MQRTIDTARLDTFCAAYLPNLERAVRERPGEYCYPVEHCPTVAAKMRKAFEDGSYNHDGLALRWTRKALGLKDTRSAMEAYFRGE